MKIKINRDLLLGGLIKVSKAISTKNLIPVLAGVKFEVKKNKLVLTASDNDITIEVVIEADDNKFIIEREGGVVIQGKYILDIVRKIPDEYINIEVLDDLIIFISTKNSEFNLNGISNGEYPNINLDESKKKISINSDIFKNIVNQTVFAASIEENKPILTGINFNVNQDILECNSTDSYRLARKVIKLNNKSDENYNIVIPSHNILEFSKILNDYEEEVEIHIFSNKVLFKLNDLKFESRLINGTYPNTSNLLPAEVLTIINCNINDIYDVIDRVSILSSDKEKNTVTLEAKNNEIILKSNSSEVGRVEEKMVVNKNNEEEIKISFSARYMMDALKSFSTKTVDIYLVGEAKPILIKSKEDETLTQLVLPIRTY